MFIAGSFRTGIHSGGVTCSLLLSEMFAIDLRSEDKAQRSKNKGKIVI